MPFHPTPILHDEPKAQPQDNLNPPTPKKQTTALPKTHPQNPLSHQLSPHPEGGYFHQTDRHPVTIPSPWGSSTTPSENESPTRSLSTTIYYLLTPDSRVGTFHRNRGRTVHTLHRGRGRYILLREGEDQGEGGEAKPKASVESFVVGKDTSHGERMQWVVEGGVWKGCFLEEAVTHGNGEGDDEEFEGMLISETVVPGFEMEDHEFLSGSRMKEILSEEQARELAWMLRENHPEFPSV